MLKSGFAGKAAVIRPNGTLLGGIITAAAMKATTNSCIEAFIARLQVLKPMAKQEDKVNRQYFSGPVFPVS